MSESLRMSRRWGCLSPSPSGAVGATVTISGVGFNSGSQVHFNGVAATTVTFVSSGKIEAKVPTSATTGPITITNSTGATGTVRSPSSFTVS